MARLKKGSAAALPFSSRALLPKVKARRASKEFVVASSSGLSYLLTETRDSPSFSRSSDAAWPSAPRTFSLLSAVLPTRTREAPVLQSTASRFKMYCPPSAEIFPTSIALDWLRWQISRVTSWLSGVFGERLMHRRAGIPGRRDQEERRDQAVHPGQRYSVW